MFVKPREGLKILRPDTRTVLLSVGEHVPKTGFWLRRLKDGDIVTIKETKAAEPKIVIQSESKKKKNKSSDKEESKPEVE